MDLNDIKIDCSSIASIMGDSHKGITELQLTELERLQKKEVEKTLTPRQANIKAELEYKRDFVPDLNLSDGCKSYLLDLYCRLYKGKRKPNYIGAVSTVLKGTRNEAEALRAVAYMTGEDYCVDKRRVSNEYLAGKLDGFLGESLENALKVIDTKCSWDMPTFYASVRDGLDSAYEYQMQGYMAITGAQVADVAIVLLNTPEILLEEEYKKARRRLNLAYDDPEFIIERERIRAYHTYDEIPINERICIFTVERDDERIENIYKKVVECRKWLMNFDQEVAEKTGKPQNGRSKTIIPL